MVPLGCWFLWLRWVMTQARHGQALRATSGSQKARRVFANNARRGFGIGMASDGKARSWVVGILTLKRVGPVRPTTYGLKTPSPCCTGTAWGGRAIRIPGINEDSPSGAIDPTMCGTSVGESWTTGTDPAGARCPSLPAIHSLVCGKAAVPSGLSGNTGWCFEETRSLLAGRSRPIDRSIWLADEPAGAEVFSCWMACHLDC